jgi:hypothetical protein
MIKHSEEFKQEGEAAQVMRGIAEHRTRVTDRADQWIAPRAKTSMPISRCADLSSVMIAANG